MAYINQLSNGVNGVAHRKNLGFLSQGGSNVTDYSSYFALFGWPPESAPNETINPNGGASTPNPVKKDWMKEVTDWMKLNQSSVMIGALVLVGLAVMKDR